jgi:hypothetical protein
MRLTAQAVVAMLRVSKPTVWNLLRKAGLLCHKSGAAAPVRGHTKIRESKSGAFVTWNCKHIAGGRVRAIVQRINDRRGIATPVICTPEELMEV